MLNNRHLIGKLCGLLPQPALCSWPPLCPAQALDPTELKSEALVLSLEEQLSALTLSELDNLEPSSTVALNGKCFQVELFEDVRESTKVLLSLLF